MVLVCGNQHYFTTGSYPHFEGMFYTLLKTLTILDGSTIKCSSVLALVLWVVTRDLLQLNSSLMPKSHCAEYTLSTN